MEECRYLALDVGTKRIGVAISDPLAIIAQPLKTISRSPEQQSIEEIEKLCKEYNVSAIVIGLPKNMDGSLGSQAQDVMRFTKKLEAKIKMAAIFEDERLSSVAAEQMLIEQNIKPSRNKSLIDMAAAAIILQSYLDRRR